MKNTDYIPSSLYLNTSALDTYFFNRFLAPVDGTELSLGMTATKLKFETKISDYKSSSTTDFLLESLLVSHAFGRYFFLGGKVSLGQSSGKTSSESSYSSNDSESSTSSEGVADPILTMGTRIYSKPVTTILALSGQFDSGASETENRNNKESNSNMKSGGSAIIPSIAVHSNNLPVNVGGMVSYGLESEKKSKYKSSSGKTSNESATGGNVFSSSVFLESTFSKLSLGGSIDYFRKESSKYVYNDNSETKGNDLAFGSLSTYVNFKVGKMYNLIPSLSYGQVLEGLNRDQTKSDLYTLAFTARGSF